MAAKNIVCEANTLTPGKAVSLCSTLTDEQETVIREVISRVTDKWSLWALSELAQHGPLRFSRLMDRVEGVSQKSLTATLRHLERDGLINRKRWCRCQYAWIMTQPTSAGQWLPRCIRYGCGSRLTCKASLGRAVHSIVARECRQPPK